MVTGNIESADPALTNARPLPPVRALLNELIDYAGLFPPAKLDMQSTVQNYAQYLDGEHGWLLGRLIVPAARLDDCEAAAVSLLPTNVELDEPWRISAITSPAGDPQLADDVARIAAFNESHAVGSNGLAAIDVIELKANSIGEIETALDAIPDELFPFFELTVDVDPRGSIAALAGSDAGAKIRTGGVTADVHPSVEQVGGFIAACASASVPFKATAGLHQPLRHHADQVQADQFGFLNIFLAGAFAYGQGMGLNVMHELLDERDAAAFRFNDDSITWRDRSIDTDAIDDARLMFAVSFGSCSIDEPVEALQAMQLL